MTSEVAQTASWLQTTASHVKRHADNLEQLLQELVEAMEGVSRDASEEQMQAQYDNSKQYARMIRTATTDHAALINTLTEYTKQRLPPTKLADIFVEQREDLKKKWSEKEILSHPKVRQAREMAGVNAAGGDDAKEELEEEGFIVAAVEVSLRCPFKGATMEVPFRNSLCGHVYDRDTVLSLLSSKKSRNFTMKCGALGCNQVVKKGNLSLDKAMERRLNAAKKDGPKKVAGRKRGAAETGDLEEL